MIRSRTLSVSIALSALVCLVLTMGLSGPARAADHGDGPTASNDQAADIADLYAFLDPDDTTKIVLIATFRGFIVPSEAGNFGIFDPGIRYRFEIENTGDEKPDRFIEVAFNRKTASGTPQTATITLPGSRNRPTAPATLATLGDTAPAPIVTELDGGVSFFAGEVDDPFFFDIPGFNRFVASVLGGTADPTRLDRGRDSFAGYNIMAIALRFPASLVSGGATTVGFDSLTLRGKEGVGKDGEKKSEGSAKAVDRTGNPAVNVALVPFPRKNEYNASTTKDDAKGKFAADIVGTLTALGTSTPNINVLAGVAVTNGDFLRLDLTIPNTGSGGGNNAAAAFPNGRRLRDDVIDTYLFIITNGAITAGDNVDANDVPLRDIFPFLAAAQQPRVPGVVDDNTRN